jgi:hypothetical protein
MRREIPYIDRLAQAQWFERFGFVAFALVGCVGILLGKAAGAPEVAVTLGAVAIMVVYAAVMWRAIAGRIRADQAGDNLYYLGLLFTLTGLAYAIFTFRPEDKSNAIVEGFGIALATTIVGLMLRVFFNQVRADLVEIEDRARLELAQAAAELKAELNNIVVEMNDFGRQTRQSLGEAVSGVEAGMVKSVKEAGAGLAKLSVKAEEKVTAAFERLDGCADELVGSTTQASAAITENAALVRELGKNLGSVTAKLGKFSDNAERVATVGETLEQQASEARAIQIAVRDTSVELESQVRTAALLLGELRSGLEESIAAQDARLKVLQEAPILAVEQVARLIDELEQRVGTGFSEAMAANAELMQAQLAAVRSGISTLQTYNEQLAGELDKSRGYATEVHSSLVSAVNDLTNRLN